MLGTSTYRIPLPNQCFNPLRITLLSHAMRRKRQHNADIYTLLALLLLFFPPPPPPNVTLSKFFFFSWVFSHTSPLRLLLSLHFVQHFRFAKRPYSCISHFSLIDELLNKVAGKRWLTLSDYSKRFERHRRKICIMAGEKEAFMNELA